MTGAGTSAGRLAVGAWLSARTPLPPEQLAARLGPAKASQAPDGPPVNEELALLALQRLDNLIAAGDHSRAIAAELLAVDALVTYACEAAAERWRNGELGDDALTKWCDEFAARIAGVAGPSS